VLTIFFTAAVVDCHKVQIRRLQEIRSGSFCALKAKRVPSGDHENSPTLNLSPSVSRFGPQPQQRGPNFQWSKMRHLVIRMDHGIFAVFFPCGP